MEIEIGKTYEDGTGQATKIIGFDKALGAFKGENGKHYLKNGKRLYWRKMGVPEMYFLRYEKR